LDAERAYALLQEDGYDFTEDEVAALFTEVRKFQNRRWLKKQGGRATFERLARRDLEANGFPPDSIDVVVAATKRAMQDGRFPPVPTEYLVEERQRRTEMN
jgi:hypothetical protein